MGKPLDEYRRKRDFGQTPEPPPAPPRGIGKNVDQPVFVVHRHDASRLHFDLRIERDGVLCSWAIPKGFSYDPEDKHLAVRTEDHPLEYEDFHGVIPKGEYGAGTMTIWDRGHFEFVRVDGVDDPIEAGEVKLILRGRRLRGEWHLVKTNQGPKTWLLFKTRDRYAGSKRDSALGVDLAGANETALPTRIPRMRCGSHREPFSDPAWLFEARFEGKRAQVVKRGDEITIRGVRKRLPAIEACVRALRAENAILDGLLVATDDDERPSRELLNERLAARRAPVGTEVVFYAFDLLYFDDYDLRDLRLIDRKAGLRATLPPLETVLFMDHVPGNGEHLIDVVRAAGLDGVIAKRADSTYTGGKSADWVDVSSSTARHARSHDDGGDAGGGEVPNGAVRAALARLDGDAPKRRVKYSNLDKVYWPETGFTKGDLIAYYESVADLLVPYLIDRPIHLNRFPDGIEGKSFYQKEIKEGAPDWIRTVRLASRHREGGVLEYMICDDRETLLYLANLGSIDLHPWMSRVETPDSPDYAVIDLDPKEAPFTDVIRIAREVGDLLHAIGLRPLLKTSGKTGLHVVIPLEPGYTYDHSVMFCEGVARVVARDLPGIATVERAIGNREGKVYVDFGQNRKGQTVVPPYVVRPARGATVSTPLTWDELTDDLRPSQFTIQTVPERLQRVGDLFDALDSDRQNLASAIESLQHYVRKGRY